MNRFVVLWSNDDSLNQWALSEEREALRWAVEGEAGLGLGWVQEGRSLLQRHPRVQSDTIELGGLLTELRARVALGCILSGAPRQEMSELAPFRFRSWLYAAVLEQALGEEVRGLITATLPDFLRRNLEGHSDVELLFHQVLAALYKRDVFNMAMVDGRLVADALADALAALDGLAPDVAASMQAALVTERLVVGVTRGQPMALRQWRGVEEPAPSPLFAGHKPRAVVHAHYKGALLVSGAQPVGARWEQIAAGSIFWIGRDGVPNVR
jgi:hypothetical protein